MKQDQIRCCSILLPESCPGTELKSIGTLLSQMESVLSYAINGPCLNLEYSFPEISFATVWGMIKSQVGEQYLDRHTRWKYKLRAYLETNEQDHQLGQYGWQSYVTDIYVAHFDMDRLESNKKKLWQHYNQPASQKKTV